MRLMTWLGAAAAAVGVAVVVPSSIVDAKPSVQQARVLCLKAISSHKTVTNATVNVCNIANEPSRTDCDRGQPVWEAYVPPGDSALLRVGHKPVVFTEKNFYESDALQLCGDPPDPTLTPPKPPMSPKKVKSVIALDLRTGEI